MQRRRLQSWQRWNARRMKLNDFNWLNTDSCRNYKTRRTGLHWSNPEIDVVANAQAEGFQEVTTLLPDTGEEEFQQMEMVSVLQNIARELIDEM
eukprot:5357654-Prorocentrum_lima.AAC.1